tara:strand:- start:28300 stop:29484 length:1185 start_codon:yes stop_codon:yes gene_type:complete
MQHEAVTTLPEPDEASAEHSARVAQYLRDRIEAAGGSISFAEFMHETLYAPGLGYYTAGTTKFGSSGDFVTAPEVSALFGRVVARQCAEVLATVPDAEVLELGAGSGRLAVDMLRAFEALGNVPRVYRILEVSADLQERQRQCLQRDVPHLVDRVCWLSDLPDRFHGVIVANEVLDALPVERFVRRGSDILQIRVRYDGQSFVQTEDVAPQKLQRAVSAIEVELGAPFADGFTSELSQAVPALVGGIAACLRHGMAFFFDYGVTQREYYAADRNDGWLRCHYRHFAHNDPLILPGIQDLTAWVNFTAVAEAAVTGGLDIHGYQTQAQFLLGGGIQHELENLSELDAAEQLKLSGQVKRLTLPGEMGENFKCMAIGRGDIETPAAFYFADRTQTL